MVGHERFRRRAAGNRVHHRGFDFEIMLVHHEITHGLDDLAAFDKGIARFFVGNQIDVTLAVFGFLIAQAFVFVGQRAQGFGQQADVRHAHGQFAVVGFEQSTFRADDVAQVPMVEIIQNFLTHAFVVQVKLDLTGHVLNGGKTRLAHLAFEHHTAGNFDGNGLRVEFFLADFAVLGMQISSKVVALEVVGIGVALLADVVQFFAAQGDDLVFVQLRLGLRIVLFAHLVSLIKNRQLNLPDRNGVNGEFYAVSAVCESKGRLKRQDMLSDGLLRCGSRVFSVYPPKSARSVASICAACRCRWRWRVPAAKR